MLRMTDALDMLDCPTCAAFVSGVYSAGQLRDELRAIMRAGSDASAVEASTDQWWPADLIREVTEWHDAGRPTAAEVHAALERRRNTLPKREK